MPRAKRNALVSLSGVVIAASLLCVAVAAGGGTSLAIPVSTPPPGHRPDAVTPAPSPTAIQTLAFDSSLLFVLDDPISSQSTKTNATIAAHLRDPLIVNGITVAPAGAPASIRVLHATPAQAGDFYGYVDIAFLPLHLPDGQDLPLRTPTSHITAYVSTGHDATVGVEDSVTDIFFPAHMLYQVFRKGRNVTLGVGSVLRARTVATIAVSHGVAVVQTPKPLPLPVDVPATSYRALPFVQMPTQEPKPTRTPPPTPEPTPTATPGTSPVPSPT
ncbi:MAG TPA: hypothetical protein VMS32_06225 [Verrucomicrobiae bacterium]|nr:hypothetical protein [Verrucomicrobiae bacterium]